MRLTALFLLAAGLTASASGFSQKVTLSEKNAPLEKVFREIKQQTGYEFLYTDEMLEPAAPVTVELKNANLADALAACFKGQPLTFAIIEKTVVVKVKKEFPGTMSPDTTSRRGVTVTGRVVDEKGEGLAGASVEVKNGKKSTLTNEKGGFELKNVPVGATLVVSYTGYQKKEVEVNEGDLKTVVLAIADNQLDQAQVVAYGNTTERLSTGNVTTVSSKEIEEQPVSNPLLALEGRVPGLFITQTNGIPGSAVTARIQGQNSILQGNNPFYVIDGVPYSSQGLQSLNYAGGNGDPLNFINPSDIESISVLKDADATAIYGSRAANGAILITTKKGKAGDTRVGFNLQNGWGHITRELPVMNTSQYLQMRYEAINNNGLTVQPTDYDINGTWDTTRNIDWQKVLIGGTSQYTNLDASVSGGTPITQYLVGGTYHRETAVFPGSFADQKASLHFSLNTKSSNKKFGFQLSGSYLFENNQLPGADLTNTAIKLAPDAPPLLNQDGSLNWALDQNGNATWPNTNPLAYTLQTYTNKNNNLVSNVILSYHVLPGLEIKSNFGYTNQQVNESGIMPLISIAPAQQPYANRAAIYSNNNSNSWIIEPQMDYKKSLGSGMLEALVGSTIEQNNSNTLQFYGMGYNSDLVLEDPRSASSITIGGSSAVIYKYAALFSRLSYNWNDKYIVNLTERRDGSSRFGPANEFHDFGAIGTAWIFSKESFIQNNMSFLSFGKLKASYGTTGNDQIGDYQFLSLYGLTNALPYQGIVGIIPLGLTNPYLQWEETRKLEFGLDLGFLKDRILLNGIYVRNRSSNELLGYTLPSITGFTGIDRNFPATIQNAGWEFILTTVTVKTKNFNWSTHVNLTIPNNKLVSFPDLASSSYGANLEIGKPLNGKKVYHFLGVNDTTGVYQFASSKGLPTSNPAYGTDNTVWVSLTPRIYGGFENSFTYKGLQLDVLFQYVQQKGLNDAFGNYPGGFYWGNQPTYVLNHWQNPGDHTQIQRYTTEYSYIGQWSNAATNSDAGYTDASFIRLRNLALSWQLPMGWRGKAHLESCKIYVQGQNLITITHYKGMDPENPTGGYSGLPPLRMLTVGIQTTL